jgi:trehalose-6-phosphatase
MKLVIDLDGTICSEEKQFSRAMAVPLKGAINALNLMKAQGHTIIIYSARAWAEYEMTVDWLDRHGANYDQLVLGKPQGDYWVDDRALQFTDWESILEKIL